jgi:hypothetical protein
MPRPSRRLLVALAVCCCAPLFAAAQAQASATALIQDCLTNGRVVGHYSAQDYSQALANLPTDVAEYSDCTDVIRRAQLAAAGPVTKRSAELTAQSAAAAAAAAALAANPRQDPLASAAPAERAAIADARRGGSAGIDVGGQVVRPGVVAVRTASILNALPTPLLLALGGLALFVLAVCGRHARDLVRARRSG